jgi:hypothetical protein
MVFDTLPFVEMVFVEMDKLSFDEMVFDKLVDKVVVRRTGRSIKWFILSGWFSIKWSVVLFLLGFSAALKGANFFIFAIGF